MSVPRWLLCLFLVACTGSVQTGTPGDDDDDVVPSADADPLAPDGSVDPDAAPGTPDAAPAPDGTPTPVYGTLSPVPEDTSVFDPAPPAGFYVYLPSNYDLLPNATWPTIFFFPGIGEIGDGRGQLGRLLNTGLPAVINRGDFPAWDKFVVFAVQTDGFADAGQVDAFVTFALSKYRLDATRLYMTGLSYGAMATWAYQNSRGDSSVFAAIVPISGDGGAQNGAQFKHVGVWAFHGRMDGNLPYTPATATTENIDRINAAGPDVPARCTIYANTGHDPSTWDRTYDLTGSTLNEIEAAYAPFDMSIYDWMLLFHR